MISSKIIIPSLMAVSIITILNSSNLFTDQIVYAQTVIDKLNVRNETTAIEFNPVNEEMFVVNKGNISVGKQPERILYLPTNNLLYVSSRNGSVSVIDPITNTVKKNINIGTNTYPRGLDFVPYKNSIYVVGNGVSKIYEIDVVTNTIVDDITVPGSSLQDIVFSPINNYLYVTNSGLNTVIVIDTSNNTVVATIPVRSGPSGIEIVPSIDKIYVASYVNNSITVIDTKTNNINFIENVGKTPIEVIYSPHSKSLYVSLLEDSKVIVINPISNIVTATIPVGQSPWGMTFDLNNHLYVANSVNKSVSVIDTKTNNIKYTIKNIGDRPLDIEFVPSSNMLYIVDFFGDRVWYTSTEFLQIKDIAEQYDQFGSTLAAGDFNNDGYKDLAIGVPEEDVKIGEENRENVGVINVIYGSSLGLTAAKNEIWYQGNNGILETAEQDDRFSNALAAGDFNNNGLDDLAIGVPNENIVNKGTIGIINVIYGTEYGLRSASNQIWYPGNNGILEPQFGSRGFGNALAAGNFGKGNADDLAIGVPTGGLSQGGSINVIYGSPTGLTSTGNQVWYQGYNGIGDRPEISKGFPEGFGWTLAAGNFGKDSTDDLVIGVPGEDNEDEDFYPVSFIDAGMIHVIYGSPTGLTSTGNQILHQGSDNRFFEFYIYSDDRFYILSNDRFGNALAAGDFNNTGFDDLVIGVPGEDQETTTEIATSIKTDSGVVKVSYGSSTGLVLHRNIQLWSQDTS